MDYNQLNNRLFCRRYETMFSSSSVRRLWCTRVENGAVQNHTALSFSKSKASTFKLVKIIDFKIFTPVLLLQAP